MRDGERKREREREKEGKQEREREREREKFLINSPASGSDALSAPHEILFL